MRQDLRLWDGARALTLAEVFHVSLMFATSGQKHQQNAGAQCHSHCTAWAHIDSFVLFKHVDMA